VKAVSSVLSFGFRVEKQIIVDEKNSVLTKKTTYGHIFKVEREKKKGPELNGVNTLRHRIFPLRLMLLASSNCSHQLQSSREVLS
jgi:hypothetical protein